jgi:hypothetical protein
MTKNEIRQSGKPDPEVKTNRRRFNAKEKHEFRIEKGVYADSWGKKAL